MSVKIQSLEALGILSKKLKTTGKIVVQCHGTFDLMHPGHIRYFEAAKRLGDILFVTVTADSFVKKGMGKPVFKDRLRAESIAALSCVDGVVIDPHESSEQAIAVIRPSIFAKGADYEGKEHEKGHPTAREKALVERYGGRMHFTHDPVTFSSTALLNDHFSELPESVRTCLDAIRTHSSGETFIDIFAKMKKLRVLIVGDAILDVYHYSNFLGRSVKEEIPRVKVLASETFAGGSLAVANTVAGFCDSVGIATVLGRQNRIEEKRQEAFIRSHLKSNVRPEFFYRDDAPTVVNERYVNNEPYLVEKATRIRMRKYFGLYRINESPMPASLESEIARRLKRIASDYDVVIVTDYGLGMLTDAVIRAVTSLQQFLAINTQTNSMNFGFNLITKYPRADYVSISQPEMRLALHDKHSSPDRLTEKIMSSMRVKTVAVTLGALGVFLKDRSGDTVIPALSTNVIDNIGAGDAYLALSALGIFLGLPKIISGFIGATASALSCGIIANKTTVDRDMLLRTIQSLIRSSYDQSRGKKKRSTRSS